MNLFYFLFVDRFCLENFCQSVKLWICSHNPPTHLQFQLFQTSQAYPCSTWQAYLIQAGKRKCAKEEKGSWTSNILASLEFIMNSIQGLFPLNFHLLALGNLNVRCVPVLPVSITIQICLSGTFNFFYRSTSVDWADPCDLAENHWRC